MPVSRNWNRFCKIHSKLKTPVSVQIFANAGWSRHKNLWAVGLSTPGVQKFYNFGLKVQSLKQVDLGSLTAFSSRGTGEVLHIQSLLHKGLRTTFRKSPNCDSLVVS